MRTLRDRNRSRSGSRVYTTAHPAETKDARIRASIAGIPEEYLFSELGGPHGILPQGMTLDLEQHEHGRDKSGLAFPYGARYRVPGVGYQLPGAWYRIPGNGFAPRAGHRAPRTEPGDRVTENAHMGYASCILHPFLTEPSYCPIASPSDCLTHLVRYSSDATPSFSIVPRFPGPAASNRSRQSG
jgi:hypothetical protein